MSAFSVITMQKRLVNLFNCYLVEPSYDLVRSFVVFQDYKLIFEHRLNIFKNENLKQIVKPYHIKESQ